MPAHNIKTYSKVNNHSRSDSTNNGKILTLVVLRARQLDNTPLPQIPEISRKCYWSCIPKAHCQPRAEFAGKLSVHAGITMFMRNSIY